MEDVPRRIVAAVDDFGTHPETDAILEDYTANSVYEVKNTTPTHLGSWMIVWANEKEPWGWVISDGA
ncbi:hypothetical protein Tco_0660916 [Tanacetum coccineum]